jgi:hypothetical protein
MHTQVPQQQLHSFPTGQLCADGLHSLRVAIGVGVVATWVADADNARLSTVTNTHVGRSVGIGECDFTASGLPIASPESVAAPPAESKSSQHAHRIVHAGCLAKYPFSPARAFESPGVDPKRGGGLALSVLDGDGLTADQNQL